MNELLLGMIVIGGFCLLLGVVYPLVALLVFPFYRLFGGRQDIWSYMRSL